MTFGKRPSSVTKILVTHHPFARSDEKHAGDVVRNGCWVLKQLEGLDIDLLLGGHLHKAYHAHMKHRMISLQAGTAISRRHRGEPNSYNWLTVSYPKIDLEVRVYDGREFSASLSQSWNRRNLDIN